MGREQLLAVKEQIALYKKWRKVLQFGSFYRGRNFSEGTGYHTSIGINSQNTMEWTCVSPGKERAVGMLFQKLVVPNDLFAYYRARGLKEDACYHFFNRSLKYSLKDFGGLVNMIAPIHIKQDSLVETIAAKVVKLDGETEDCFVYGDELMYHGVKLKQAFGSVGYHSEVRIYQDFGSRMYFMEKVADIEKNGGDISQGTSKI